MRKLTGTAVSMLLLLSGCAGTTSEAEISEAATTSAETEIDTTPPLVSAWLRNPQVSAQQILEDLTYEGVCNEWGEEPSPDSEYGQAYKRDFVRECTSGRTKFSAPDCDAYLSIGTMDQAIQAPVDMAAVYEGSYLALFSNPKFSIDLVVSMSEFAFETDLQRCWGTIVHLGELLGDSVETQILGDYAITSALNLKPLDEAFGENPDEWFALSDEVFGKWEENGTFSCPTWMEQGCWGLSLQTLGWCENLAINYDILGKNGKVLESSVATLASEVSYAPFLTYLDATVKSGTIESITLNEAECSSWIR